MLIPLLVYTQCKEAFTSTDPGIFVSASGIIDGANADGFSDGIFTSYLDPQSYIEFNYPFVRMGGEICLEVAYFSATSQFILDLNGISIPIVNPGGTNFPQSLEFCIPVTTTGSQNLRLTALAGFVFADGSFSSYCEACDPAIPDSDGDQICDDLDQCPYSATGDADFDGICDDQDICFAGNDFFDIDNDGIPFFCDYFVDTDQNGIEDNQELGFPIELIFSHTRGFYDHPFKLEIAGLGAGVQIRYTLDNSKPVAGSGLIYFGPILFRKSTTVRVLAYNATDTTEIISHSYLFTDDVINDTNMSKHITQDSVYGPQLKTALKALPVLSVVSNQVFPTSAINQETEVSVELFYPDSSRKGFMLHSGIQTWGGSPSNPKRHYRLEFKSQYGSRNLDYDVFKSDNYDATVYPIPPVKKFKRLLLRAGSQDGLNAEFGNEIHTQFIRNRVMGDLFMKMGYPTPHGRFVNLFVNGAYAGQFHFMERPDEHFLDSYYGKSPTDYEVYKNGQFPNGNQQLYDTLNQLIDVTTENNALISSTLLDMEQTAAYLVLMSYASGFDWNQTTNCLGFGSATLPYKFIPWDMDFSLGNGGIFGTTGAFDPNYFEAPLQFGPVPLSLQNELYFKFKMTDQLACACYNDGPLTADFVDSIYQERAGQIRLSMIAEAARWGDYDYTNPYAQNMPKWTIDDFDNEFNRVTTSYIPERTDNLIQYWKDNGFTSTLDPVTLNQFDGEVDSTFQLVLSHTDPTIQIYYTLNGNDPRTFTGGINPTAIPYTGPISLPDGVVTLKARALNSSNINNTINRWSGMCPKTFYKNIDYNSIVINEILYDPNPDCAIPDSIKAPFIELINTGTHPIDLTNCVFTNGFSYAFPVGAILNPNELLVLTEDSTAFKTIYDKAPFGEFHGGIASRGETIELSSPIGKIIDVVSYDNSHPWDKAPSGNGPSLELLHPETDNADPFNWFRSDQSCGTPGEVNSRICNTVAASVVINEINYNSDNQNFDPGDWVELYNPDSIAVALDGWTFYDDKNAFVFPSNTLLAPHAFLVLAEDGAAFQSAFPETTNYIGDFQFGLNDKGERLSLFTPEKCLSDYVIYNDSNGWPIEANGNGPTLSLNHLQSDNSVGSSWSASSAINSPYGTPGRANEPCPTFTINHPDTVNRAIPVLLTATSHPQVRYRWFSGTGSPLLSYGDSVWISFHTPGITTIDVTRFYFECEETVTIAILVQECNTLNITMILEGAYDQSTQLMRTNLNSLKLLPGMNFNPVGGQPYSQAPWLYTGTEGLGWIDASYPSNAVDWVLVSLRKDLEKSSEAYRLVGLLHANGSVSWQESCVLPWPITGDYYIQVEHRNHFGALTPQPVTPINRRYIWDFSAVNSYVSTGFGQVMLDTAKWGLIAGDSDKLNDVFSYDINSADNIKWLTSNGIFNRYLEEDHNLDGDVSVPDRMLWFRNNGKFSNVQK